MKAELAKKLAKRMRKLRGNETQGVFAKRLGVDRTTICRIESQSVNVTLSTLDTICSNLRCEIGDLFSDKNR